MPTQLNWIQSEIYNHCPFPEQEEADRKRRDEFKRYEMEKKFEHDQVIVIFIHFPLIYKTNPRQVC